LSPGEFIEALYFKQFRKAQPDVVQTIEQLAEMHEEKRAERISAKLAQAAPASPDASVDEELVDEELPPLGQTPSQTGSQS